MVNRLIIRTTLALLIGLTPVATPIIGLAANLNNSVTGVLSSARDSIIIESQQVTFISPALPVNSLAAETLTQSSQETSDTFLPGMRAYTGTFSAAPGVISYVSKYSGPWDEPQNWSPNGIPGEYDDVTVSHDIYLYHDTEINTVRVNPQGQVNVATSILTIHGDLIDNTLAGQEEALPVGNLGSGIAFSSRMTQTIGSETGTKSEIRLPPTMIDRASDALTAVRLTKPVVIDGDLQMKRSAWINLQGYDLELRKDLIDDRDGVNLNPNASAVQDSTNIGKVKFKGDNEQQIRRTLGPDFPRTTIVTALEIDKTEFLGNFTNRRLKLSNSLAVKGDLILKNKGQVELNGKELHLKKDLVDDSSVLEAITDASNIGKVSLDGDGISEQKIRSISKSNESQIKALVEIAQPVKLEKNVRLKEHLKLPQTGHGRVDVNGKILALEKDLIDDSGEDTAINDSLSTSTPGKVSFEGAAEHKVRSEIKTAETKLQVLTEVKQKLTLKKHLRIKELLRLADNGLAKGSIDVAGKNLSLEKDVADNSSADEAISDSQSTEENSGKVSFEGSSEQKVKSENNKTAETKVQALTEIKQKVKLLKHLRLKGHLKLSDKDANNKGSIDIAGKNMALEKDVVDDSSEDTAINDSQAETNPGKVSFEGEAEQSVRSESKTAETKVKATAEIKQGVKLLKHLRLKENVKLSNKDSINKGYIDVAGKTLAMEKDLVDNSNAELAITDTVGSGIVSIDNTLDQSIRSDSKYTPTQIRSTVELRKPTGKFIIGKKATLLKTRFGAVGLTVQQNIELRDQVSVNVDETLAPASFRQSYYSGSTISTLLRSILSTITLQVNNQVIVQRGSMIIEVVEGPAVVANTGDVTITIPTGANATIEEPVVKEITVDNNSTNPGAGDVTVTEDGVTDTVSPGETATATVENVVPFVGQIAAPSAPIQVGTAFDVSARFTDSGSSDAHLASWAWGDGSSSSGSISEVGGFGSVTGSHTYNAPGIYTITLTVTNKDGLSGTGKFQFAVVYDPSAGFVTGGGWINSPARAYASDPLLSGKANFSFESRYQKGTTVPTGNTEFQFKIKTGNLNFKSASHEWLVIAGARAYLKGTGTINGAGNYGFLISTMDGKFNGSKGTDKFRIKIWDAFGKTVYDNQMNASDDANLTTAIGGGSIIIHK